MLGIGGVNASSEAFQDYMARHQAATGQAPVVVATGAVDANGQPVTQLPTEGPIFQSGEVVQGETKADATTGDDKPVP